MKTKLINNGFIYFDDSHQVKLTFKNEVLSKILKKDDTTLFIEKFNNEDDIEILVKDKKVKENIIINKKRESYKYKYNLELTNLALEKVNEEYVFLDKETKTKLFKLSDFIMYDNKKKESKDILVLLNKLDEKMYELEVIPSSNWINSEEVELPVVVDPSVESISVEGITFTSNLYNNLITTSSLARLGNKGNTSYTVDIDIDYSIILSEVTNRGLLESNYNVFLELHYVDEKSNVGTLLKVNNLTNELKYQVDGRKVLRIDLTKLVGYPVSDNISITLSYNNQTSETDDYIDIITSDKYGVNQRPRLVLECKELNDLPNYTKEVQTEAGKTVLDLHNGSFHHVVSVGSIKHNALNLSLDLVLNSNLLFDKSLDITTKHMSKGWKTNFHQYLKKTKIYNKMKSCYDVTYIDGKGFEHKLVDRWFYVLDGIRYYVDKSKVYFNETGVLKTLNRNNEEIDVYQDLENEEGLMYISDRGNYYFNTKEEIVKQKRYYIYIGDKKVYLYEDQNNKLHLPLFMTASEDYIYCFEQNYSDLIYSNNKFLKYDDEPSLQEIASIYAYSLCSIPSEITGNSFDVVVVSPNEYTRVEKVYFEETCFNSFNSTVNTDNEDILSLTEQISNIKQYVENTKSSINNYVNIFNKTYEDYEYQKELYEKTGSTYYIHQKHMMFSSAYQYIEQYLDSIDQLNYYNYLLSKKEVKLERLISQDNKNVKDLIIDKNNNVLGFDGMGRLIVIADGYKNQINIVYGDKEDVSKILSIESETDKLSFEYENDLLSKIMDKYGRIVEIKNTSINGYNNSLKLRVKDNEYEFINSPSTYYINNPYGKVVELGLSNEKVTEVRKYITGNVDEVNNPFSGVKDKGVKYSYTYSNNETIETITKFHDLNYNKTNNYKFDSLGRLINSINHKKDYVINEYLGDNLIKEYTFNKDNDLCMDSNKSITSDFKIESSFNTTVLFAYIINTNGVLNKELTINLLLYKVEEDNTNTYLKTISKKVIVDKDTVVVSFEVPKDIKVFVKTYNSSTLSADNINSIYVVRLEGNKYIYDSNDHLIKVLNPDSITVYEDYQGDNPTKVTTTNIKDNKVMVSKYNFNSNNQMTYQEDYLGNVLEVEFNELGQVVEKRSYNIKEPTLCKKERYKYDDNGNVATLDGVLKDGDGNIPSTSVEYLRGLESKVKSPSGNVVNYGYDFNTDKLLSLSSEVNGISNVTRFKYKRNLLESLEHDGFKVSYKFDKLERITEVLVNNETYLTTEYDDNFSLSEASIYYGNKVTTTYNNGYVTSSLFDIDGLLRRIYKDSNYKAYTYDNKENITSVITNDGTINKTYEYDSYDNIIKETSTGNGSVYTKEYNYDDKQRLSNEVDTYNNKTFNYDYSYNEQIDSLLDSISLSVDDTNINKSYGYDVLNRKNKECLSINDEEFIKEEYEYLAVEDNALDLIKEHNIVFKGNLLESDTYEYDLNGNIIKVITDENEIRYHYDSLSRLIREDNPLLNKTIIYKYDKKGNITLRKEYTYSLDINLLNPNKIDKFTYGLKNELLKYNDEECEYDSMGRPTTYRGMTTSWNSDGTLANMGGKYSYIRRNFDGTIYERREGTHPYLVSNTITDGNKILVDNGLIFIFLIS